MRFTAVSTWMLALLLTSWANAAPVKGVGTAYVIPFSIETYLPFTAENIDKAFRKRPCVLTIEGTVHEIVTAAKPSEKVFDKYEVRAKISEGSETLVIDTFGIFEANGQMLEVAEEDMKNAVRKHSKCTLRK